MLNTLSIYEAKTHFSSFVHRANLGEAFVVTSHGKPLARIVPLEAVDLEAEKRARKTAAIERIKALQNRADWPKITAEEAKEWAHEGHRWA
jgi:prevent-host-death family protein